MALTHVLDTSVFTRLRHPGVLTRVDSLVGLGVAGRAGITDLELGASARNAGEWDLLMESLEAVTLVETTDDHFRRARQVQRLLAETSQRGRPIPDLLVAAAAERMPAPASARPARDCTNCRRDSRRIVAFRKIEEIRAATYREIGVSRQGELICVSKAPSARRRKARVGRPGWEGPGGNRRLAPFRESRRDQCQHSAGAPDSGVHRRRPKRDEPIGHEREP